MTFCDNGTLIVTGASSGIGRALSLILAREGCNLVLNARRGDRLHQLAEHCMNLGARTAVVAGDASESKTVHKCVQEALRLGNFHGFIHAAGILKPGPSVWEMDAESFRTVVDASLTAAHMLIHHAVPHLIKQHRGLAVFFGSGAAEKTQPGIGAYCAAKAGEEHLARQLAAETQDVLTIIWRPGIVETDMQRQARHAEGISAETLKSVFVPWKEKGMLLTPEASAQGLVDFLKRNPTDYHGKIADIRAI